jgi:hypothetical protein
VNAEVGLAVAIEVQSTQFDRARDRQLEDASIDRSPLINGKARTSDVQRKQFHGIVSFGVPWCSMIQQCTWIPQGVIPSEAVLQA